MHKARKRGKIMQQTKSKIHLFWIIFPMNMTLYALIADKFPWIVSIPIFVLLLVASFLLLALLINEGGTR